MNVVVGTDIMSIQIRKLTPNESNLYRKIRLECLREYPENFSSDFEVEKSKKTLFFQPFIESSSTNNFIIGAFHENNLIGICGFNRYDKAKTNHRGRIIHVYVTPSYQGHNIGHGLVKATVDNVFKTTDTEQIEINVLTTNTKAKGIYERLGFESYGIQKRSLKINGDYHDQNMMVLFKNQYKSMPNSK